MWNGFESKEFLFRECKATIVYPKGKPLGRMLYKPEYLSSFPAFDIAMLEKGYYVIHMQQKNRWAADEETHLMAEFVGYCAGELGASKGCVLEGLSLGGLQAARFAQLYPELTAVLYLDAPVLNIPSMAGLGSLQGDFVAWARECIREAYGVEESALGDFRHSPIDHMDILVEKQIPMIMVYGDADKVVNYGENGKLLEAYCREKGGLLETICKPGCDHHPHGLEDPGPVVDFVERYFA